jgi:hypothetical protein
MRDHALYDGRSGRRKIRNQVNSLSRVAETGPIEH